MIKRSFDYNDGNKCAEAQVRSIWNMALLCCVSLAALAFGQPAESVEPEKAVVSEQSVNTAAYAGAVSDESAKPAESGQPPKESAAVEEEAAKTGETENAQVSKDAGDAAAAN